MNFYHEQSKNVVKTWLLMSLFFVVIIGLGWFIAGYYNNPSILYFAVFFSIFMNVLSYWFSDKIVLSMYKAQEVTQTSNPDLFARVKRLTQAAQLPMPKLYVIPDPAPNAFATGRNKNHAAVAVTSGLLERLNSQELDGVIAHELSHIGNRDILISTVVTVLVGFVAILSDMFMRSLWFGGSRDDDRGNAGAILAIIGIVFAILAPIVATIIQLAISRKREYLADATGARITHHPEGLASALEKIASYSHPMLHANNATAHLFISNPFGHIGNRLLHLFSTHPPVEDRLRILRGQK